MNPTKHCTTCGADCPIFKSCMEGDDEAYKNGGTDCDLHYAADERDLILKFSFVDSVIITNELVEKKSSQSIDCHKCKYCVIHGGKCSDRLYACMAFREVKDES